MKPKKHILLLDDDIDMINLITKVLNNVGHITHYATNILDFYNQLTLINPHLIIIDNNLAQGEKDGIHVVQYLKKNPKLKKIPTFLISASPSKKLVNLATALGAEEFIAKPIHANILLQKVKKSLGANELADIEFKELKAVTCEVNAKITQIAESAIRTLSSVKFNEEIEVQIKAPFLDKLGCQACRFKATPEHRVIGPGEYLTEIRMRGVKEETARKIRLIKTTTNKLVKVNSDDKNKNSPLNANAYILSLDDDEDFNNLLKVVFKKKGLKIITTTTCESFIHHLKNKRPSLCLIDINLDQGPGVGFSLLQALREHHDLTIPIIILSRRRDDNDITRALELGANDYVTKPLDDDFLLNKINHYLKHDNIPPLPFYKVSENNGQCSVVWNDGIRSINEFGITLQGPHFIAKGTLIKLTGDFITEACGYNDGIKVSVNHSWIDEINHLYQAQCEFNYEDETLLEHIRGYLLNHKN